MTQWQCMSRTERPQGSYNCPKNKIKYAKIYVKYNKNIAPITELDVSTRGPCLNALYTVPRHAHTISASLRISFRLAVLVYRRLHDSAPGYLASDLQRVSDLGARRRLRSSSTSALVAQRAVRATIGDRAFPAAAASVWNSLSETVRSSPSLPVFSRRLKTELFVWSYSCSASWA